MIVETNDHNKQLHDFTVEEIKSVLKVYVARTKELSQKNKYVSVFKNHGINAGTSLVHSHTQVAAMNIDPPFVMQELKASFKGGKCLYCEIIQAEKNSDRRIFDNNTFISFCPYAPRFNFEAWIFPKHHIKSITELNDDQLKDLAEVLHKILPKIAKLNASYNFVIHNAPKQHDLHFHMEILPRIAKFGGLELATNVIVQQITPEQAAEFYRE